MEEIVKLDDGALSILIIEHDMRFVMGLSTYRGVEFWPSDRPG